MMKDKRSFLAKAKGAGSSKTGSHHWNMMKLTSIALVPLILWFAYAMVGLSTMSWASQRIWLGSPMNSFLMIIFICVAAIHSANGVQVILEDYIHSKFLKFVTIYGFKALTYLAALAGIMAILFIFFNQ